jgi:acetyl-CoA carboxylase carboxyltransferase component
MAEDLRQRYDRETDIRYAAARGWVDGIIDPAESRDVLIQALQIATRVPFGGRLATGVFQV